MIAAIEKQIDRTSLQVSEVFASIQGESTWAGFPSVFVRLTGCPVRCVYCDTAYAFQGGARRSLQEIAEQVAAFKIRRVCVTGGEPLAQAGSRLLLERLIADGYHVSLETSGVRPIADLPRPLKIVLDVKTPGSGVLGDWLPENLERLQPGDELKAVICGPDDWEWFERWMDDHRDVTSHDVVVNVSPVWASVAPSELASWIAASSHDVRLNLQLHKVLWPGEARGR